MGGRNRAKDEGIGRTGVPLTNNRSPYQAHAVCRPLDGQCTSKPATDGTRRVPATLRTVSGCHAICREKRIMHRSFTPNFGLGVLARNRVRASTHPANRGKNELCTAGFRQISEKSAAYHMAPKSNARLKLRKLAGRPFSFLRRPPQRTMSMSTILPLTPQALKCRPRTGRIMPFDGGRAHKSGRGMKRVSALFAGASLEPPHHHRGGLALRGDAQVDEARAGTGVAVANRRHRTLGVGRGVVEDWE